MRALVIGGTGFIGSHVTRELKRLGHDVAVFHRGKTGHFSVQILGDRRNLPDFKEKFRHFAPEVVIDMILSGVRQAEVTMATFAGIARRVVAVSSLDVYRACGVLHGTEPGPPGNVPLTEDSPIRSKPLYAPETLRSAHSFYPWVSDDYDKVPAERIIANHRMLSSTVLRLPMVYGPGDPFHRLFPILKRIDDCRPAILLDEDLAQWRGPRGYVENVAAAIALAAISTRASGRIYNVAEREAFSELEWTGRVAAAAGWNNLVSVAPSAISPAHLKYPGDTRQHLIADSSRIRRELGYRESVPFEEALRRTITWERAHPPTRIDPRQFDYAAEDAALAQLRRARAQAGA